MTIADPDGQAVTVDGVPPLQVPAVTSQPTSTTVTSGQAVASTAVATGSPNPAVQSFGEAPGATGFSPGAGCDLRDLQLSPTYQQERHPVRSRLHRRMGTVTTNPATLTVDPGVSWSSHRPTSRTARYRSG